MIGAAVGMGTQAIGSIMQAIAANQAAKAMNEAFQKEIAQQQRFQQQGFNTLTPGIINMGADRAHEQMAEGYDNRTGQYNQVNAGPPVLGLPGSTLRDRLKLGVAGKLRAKLGSYADWQNQQGLDMSQLGIDLGRTFDRAGGQARIFPAKMDSAQHSWDQLAFMGQMIAALGGNAGNFMQMNQRSPEAMGMSTGGTPFMPISNASSVPSWGSGQSMYIQ